MTSPNRPEDADITRLRHQRGEAYRAGDEVEVGRIDFDLGVRYLQQDHLTEAERALTAARDTFSRLGLDRGVADCEYSLGIVYRGTGRYQLAERAFASAQQAYTLLGLDRQVADCEYNPGNVYRDSGQASTEIGGLIVDEQGRVSWWSALPGAAAGAAISPAPGVAVSVDLTDPRRVLSWTVPHPDALDVLVELFGPSWRRSVLDTLAGPHPPGVAVPSPPPLPDPWARHALVTGIARWMPDPLPEATLVIDQALATLGIGREEQARTELTLGSATLLDLAELCLDGDLPTAMRPGLHAATRAAATLLPADHPDVSELARLAAALHSADLVDQVFRIDPAHAGVADTLGATTGSSPTAAAEAAGSADAVATVLVDPAIVPPRILRWDGPTYPELLVETHLDQDLLRVSMALAEGTDPDDSEVTDLLVRAVDPSDGTTWSAGVPVPTTDHRLVADLPLHGRAAESVTVQLYQAGRPNPILTTVRHPALIRIDRLMLQAWSLHRLARAAETVDTPPPTGRPVDRRLVHAALDYAQQAFAELDTLFYADHPTTRAPEFTAGTPLLGGLRQAAGQPEAADLQARMIAVQAYLAVLDHDDREPTPREPADPVTAPLLAELEFLTNGAFR